MFADDMVLLAPNSGALQNKINILSDYFDRMSLKVNLGKTKIMVFKRVAIFIGGVLFGYGGG
jgi:hypothetical protein